MLMAVGQILADLSAGGELMPSPLDLEVHRRVGYEVARAAVESGVGTPDDTGDFDYP